MNYLSKTLVSSMSQRSETNNSNIVLPMHDGIRQLPEEYLLWLDYIPQHWQIEKLKVKNPDDLTKDELELLRTLYEEATVREAFASVISGGPISVRSFELVYYYMSKMTIPKYAKLKLTKEQLKECESRISKDISVTDLQELYKLHYYNFSGGKILDRIRYSIEERLEVLKGTKDVIEDYESYMLRVNLSNLNMQEVEIALKNSVSQLEVQHRRDILGYEPKRTIHRRIRKK